MSQSRNWEQIVADLKRRFDATLDTVRIGDRRFEFFRPRSADRLLDEALLDRDAALPYWAEVWPSSIVLAERVAELTGDGRRCLELGAGCGLSSLVAAAAGYEVTASDYCAEALEFVALNAWHNKLRAIHTKIVDWHDLPDDLRTFDLVIGGDVLYESHHPNLVAAAIERALSREGEAIVTDPSRATAVTFEIECRKRALVVHRDPPRTTKYAAMRHVVDTYWIRHV